MADLPPALSMFIYRIRKSSHCVETVIISVFGLLIKKAGGAIIFICCDFPMVLTDHME